MYSQLFVFVLFGIRANASVSHINSKVLISNACNKLNPLTYKILSSSLINNIKTFTYYFVASKDFTQKAKLFLADFKNKWKFENITHLLKKELKASAFKNIELEEIQPKIEELLNQLNISSLNEVDLDLVTRSNIDVINRYFSTISYTLDSVNRNNQVNDKNSYLELSSFYQKKRDFSITLRFTQNDIQLSFRNEFLRLRNLETI